ncbi:class I SAM-dependent methyltransferase, partial [Ralstonia sp. ASV6]|uniref:class I SAM-dependent methyltransferase n=1 Tax=Ralstonia sp. ASV6 TaxID=2795124 RepID=UPI0022B92DAC
DPQFTRPFRASIVARARFVDDLVVEQAHLGVTQYVILGAGLDLSLIHISEPTRHGA